MALFRFLISPAHRSHPQTAKRSGPSPFRYLARGFSLVEVTLAMGISSFAMLVIFSMLPTGMSAMQDAGRQIAEAEIFNRLGAELTSTPMYADPVDHTNNDVLGKYTQTLGQGGVGRFPAYFDYEGNEVAKGSGNIVFTAQCVLEPSAKYKEVWTPQASSSGQGELRWVTIRLGYNKDPGTPAALTPATELRVIKRTFLVANRGS